MWVDRIKADSSATTSEEDRRRDDALHLGGGQVIAEHDASTGAVQVDYLYAGGRMIAKESGGSRQYFISDRLSVRMTLDSSGNVTGRQAHLPYGEDFAETGAQEKHHFTRQQIFCMGPELQLLIYSKGREPLVLML